MILVLKNNADQKKVEELKKQLTDMGLKLHLSEGMNTSLIGLIGDTTEVDEEWLGALEVVEKESMSLIKRQIKPCILKILW